MNIITWKWFISSYTLDATIQIWLSIFKFLSTSYETTAFMKTINIWVVYFYRTKMNNGWVWEQSNFHSQKKKLMIMKVLHDNFLMRKKLLRFRERVQKFISSWTLHPSIIIVLCHCTLCRLGLWFATFFRFYRNTQMLLFECYKSYKTDGNIKSTSRISDQFLLESWICYTYSYFYL